MTDSLIYIYRHYCGDSGLYEYLKAKEGCGGTSWQWCDHSYDATAFNNPQEAKQYINKYIKEFGSTELFIAFMEHVTVMKNYYSHDILEEV